MNKREWILIQFNRFSNPTSKYRRGILLTSFVETAIRSRSANKSGFKGSLIKLGMKESATGKDMLILPGGLKDNNCLRNIEKIRRIRNKLLHDILKKRMPEKYINDLIDESGKELRIIFSRSQIIRGYFKTKYHFDTKDELH